MKKMIVLGLLSAMLWAGAAQAQSLRDRLAFQSAEREISERAARTKDACGVDIRPTFDWSAVRGDDLQRTSASSYCGEAFIALERVCGEALGKQAVQEKIKALVCGFGPRALTIEPNGTLRFVIEWDAANNSDYVYEMLLQGL